MTALVVTAMALASPPPPATGPRPDDATSASLTQVSTIALPDVSNRIDHMALDRAGRRLFIAALGNRSVEVVDLATGKPAGRIGDLNEPQGVAYLPASAQIVVSCGGDGTCRLYDAATLKEVARVDAGPDADNIRVDATSGLIYVGVDAGLAILEAGRDSLTKRGEIALAGHAESFQLESSGPRIFVNVPDAKQVQVVDRQKKTVIASWSLADERGNFPMALDEKDHRLFIACRNPAKLLVIDIDSGRVLSSLECAGDADEVFFDARRQRVYVSGGEGFIDVFTADGAADGQWGRLERVPTARGARTSLLDPDAGAVYLAVPRRGEQPAELRVFRIEGSE